MRQLDIPIGQGYLLGRPDPQLNAAPVDLANLSWSGDVAAPVPLVPGAPRRKLHLPGSLSPPSETGQLQTSPVPTAGA